MTDSPFWLDYEDCRSTLLERLTEPPPTRIQLLTGPRQVGKTTLLLEIAQRFGEAARYVAADDPNAGMPGFWERVWSEAEAQASKGRVVVLIDEIQHLNDWGAHIKGHYDRIKRRKIPIHIVATGSSALLLGAGSRESLAGRFERLTLSHWSASAVSRQFKLSPAEAVLTHIRLGSYPGSLQLRDDLMRWRAYVRDAIIEPAIGRDVLALGVVRRPALLRQVFAVAVGAPAQIVSLQKLQGQLHDRGSLETIAHYLVLLEQAYLVAPLPKYGEREHRRRAAPPKLVALNNALISAMHARGAPDQNQEPARFGLWVENACLAFACNRGQSVSYWREEPLEVDGVITGSWGDWAIEVKTSGIDSKDLRGLFEFCRRYPRFRPLVVTPHGAETQARNLGAAAVSWADFLLSGPPG
jgi:predicted AAA+ superfamily ATPase